MRPTLLALVALSVAIATPSFAQTATAPMSGVGAQHSDIMLADHTMRASKLIGSTVYNDKSESIGKVDDIVVTAGAIEPTVIVAISGGFLGGTDKLTTEPLSHLKLAPGDKMMMPGVTKASLAARPAFSYVHTGLNESGGNPFMPPSPEPTRR